MAAAAVSSDELININQRKGGEDISIIRGSHI